MKTKKIIFFLVFAPLFLAGCQFGLDTGGGAEQVDPYNGGVYVSIDAGQTWQQRVLVANVSGAPQKTVGSMSMSVMEMDPSDNNTLYLGGERNGLFYSYDKGQSWQKFNNFPVVRVDSFAIDPKDKCNLYAGSANALYKSYDCGRNWEQAYYDTNTGVKISAIAVDHYENNNVFIGTTRGDIIKSSDFGASWKSIFYPEKAIKDIYFSPYDSRIIFVIDETNQIFRTFDKGGAWENVRKNVPDEIKIPDITSFAMPDVEGERGLIILTARYNLLTSPDYGDTWEEIGLVVEDKKISLQDVAISRQNANKIYGITENAFYRSVDRGRSWASKSLPTNAKARKIIVDPENDNLVFMGFYKEPPKQ